MRQTFHSKAILVLLIILMAFGCNYLLQVAGPVDGIYLDMHGALHVDEYPDAQDDLIREIRKIVGKEVLVAASFDLHGNISRGFAEGLNILSAFPTAPHMDGEETRLRTVKLLLDALRENHHPLVAHLNIPILIPG